MLKDLPVELFYGVTSYLNFLDNKALSIASRKCNAMREVCKCPDHLTWLIHLCRSPAKLQGPLLENPGLFGALISSLREYLEYQNGTDDTTSSGRSALNGSLSSVGRSPRY